MCKPIHGFPFLYPTAVVTDQCIFWCRPAGQGDLLAAKDALGAEVKASKWIKEHKPEDRALTQGLKSDATYLIGEPVSTRLRAQVWARVDKEEMLCGPTGPGPGSTGS